MGKKITVIIIVFFAVLIFAAAWYFSTMIIYPPKKECPADHFIYCKEPSELNLAFEDISFKSIDGLTLKGWFIPSGKSKKAIIFVHGHGATRREGMRWLKAFNKAGFNTLVFDLRHSGDSDKAWISMGYHEKNDVISAVDFIDKIKGVRKIGLFGVSMGGASGIYAMSMDKRIQAGVFEASYANLNDLITEIAKRDYGLPRFPIVSLTMMLFELRARADVDDISPEKVIGSISPRPVFIMHCKDDPYIPYSHAQRIYSKAGEPKEMWTHSCKVHAEAWQADPAYIEKRVAGFFNKYVK